MATIDERRGGRLPAPLVVRSQVGRIAYEQRSENHFVNFAAECFYPMNECLQMRVSLIAGTVKKVDLSSHRWGARLGAQGPAGLANDVL